MMISQVAQIRHEVFNLAIILLLPFPRNLLAQCGVCEVSIAACPEQRIETSADVVCVGPPRVERGQPFLELLDLRLKRGNVAVSVEAEKSVFRKYSENPPSS